MATTNARRHDGDEQDVEGHGRQVRDAEELVGRRETEDDTEGHQLLPNDMLSRNAATNRERDIQRNLQKRELKSELRRPFFRRGKNG